MPCTSTRSPPTFLTKSASWVVVATIVSSAPLAAESLSPQPVARTADDATRSTASASSSRLLRMILISTASYRSRQGAHAARPLGPAQLRDELHHGLADTVEAPTRQLVEAVRQRVPRVAPVDQVDRRYAVPQERRVVIEDRGPDRPREQAPGADPGGGGTHQGPKRARRAALAGELQPTVADVVEQHHRRRSTGVLGHIGS